MTVKLAFAEISRHAISAGFNSSNDLTYTSLGARDFHPGAFSFELSPHEW